MILNFPSKNHRAYIYRCMEVNSTPKDGCGLGAIGLRGHLKSHHHPKMALAKVGHFIRGWPFEVGHLYDVIHVLFLHACALTIYIPLPWQQLNSRAYNSSWTLVVVEKSHRCVKRRRRRKIYGEKKGGKSFLYIWDPT